MTICIWELEQEVEFETDSKLSKLGIGIGNSDAWQIYFLLLFFFEIYSQCQKLREIQEIYNRKLN